jgi:hypothetical protein
LLLSRINNSKNEIFTFDIKTEWSSPQKLDKVLKWF